MADVLHVFTSAAVNYLPKVRILCHSIRRHHPEAVIHLALADERPQWLRTEDEPFDSILGIERLGIPDYRNWTFTHSIVELSTAIKPFALKHLLQLPDCAHRALLRPGHGAVLARRRHPGHARDQQSRAHAASDQARADARRDLRQRGREPEARHLQPGLHRRAQHRRRPALRRLVGRADAITCAGPTSRTASSPTRSGSTSRRCSSTAWRSSSRRGTTSPRGT